MSRRDALLPVRPARWNRPAVPAPDPVFTQEQLRDRRRRRLDVHYTGSFGLTAEVAEIVIPAGIAVSRLPWPLALRRDVDAVADGVAEVVHVAAGLIAESKAADGRTRRLAADLAVRPRQPAIADEQIVSGSWSTTLAEYAEPLDDDLAALLDRALPPDAEGLRGQPSVSERVERALRVLDRAALDLERRIPSVRQRQNLPSVSEFNRAQRERQDQERAADTLTKLGVTP